MLLKLGFWYYQHIDPYKLCLPKGNLPISSPYCGNPNLVRWFDDRNRFQSDKFPFYHDPWCSFPVIAIQPTSLIALPMRLVLSLSESKRAYANQLRFVFFLRNCYLRQAMPILKAVPSSNYLQSRSSSPWVHPSKGNNKDVWRKTDHIVDIPNSETG